jgi:hypothetical protein
MTDFDFIQILILQVKNKSSLNLLHKATDITVCLIDHLQNGFTLLKKFSCICLNYKSPSIQKNLHFFYKICQSESATL